MVANKSSIKPYQKAFTKFEFPHSLSSYWFKFNNKNFRPKKYEISLTPTEFSKVNSQKGIFNKTIFIELTQKFFNKLKTPNTQSPQVTHYLSTHYKNIETKDKPIFLDYIEHVFNCLPNSDKPGAKNEKAFLKFITERRKELTGEVSQKNISILQEPEVKYTRNINKPHKEKKIIRLKDLFKESPTHTFNTFIDSLIKDNRIIKNASFSDGKEYSWIMSKGSQIEMGYIAHWLIKTNTITPFYGKKLAEVFINEFEFDYNSRSSFEKPFQQNNQISDIFFKSCEQRSQLTNFKLWVRK
jgi:hypothetical protein